MNVLISLDFVYFKCKFGAVERGLSEGVLFGGFERHKALVVGCFKLRSFRIFSFFGPVFQFLYVTIFFLFFFFCLVTFCCRLVSRKKSGPVAPPLFRSLPT